MSHKYQGNTSIKGRHRDGDADLLLESLAMIAPEVKHFVQYEAPFPYNLNSVINSVRAVGSKRTLQLMREQLARDSIKMYGKDYPQSYGVKLRGAQDLGL